MTYCKPYWTPEMWAEAQQLRESGISFGKVAEIMGLTSVQVQHRFANARYKENMAKAGVRMFVHVPAVSVPEHVLEDRARRLSADRTLMQLVFGDPLLEDSALGRRMR